MENFNRKFHLDHIGMNVKIILNQCSKSWPQGCGLNACGSWWEPAAGFYVHDDQVVSSIKKEGHSLNS